jgi:hypothetical protein
MTLGAETIRLLIGMGMDSDDLLRIAESIERDAGKGRSASAKRQAAYKERRKRKDVESDVTRDVTQSVTPRAHVDNKLPSKEPTEKVRKKTEREDEADFKSELSELGPELLAEFVKLRRRRRMPLSGYTARLFRKDCAACSLPVSEAAELCISRGWTTVKPEFLSSGKPRQAALPEAHPKETLATMWHGEARSYGVGNG